MDHEEKLKQVNTMQGAISEQLKDAMAKAEEFKALLTNPLEVKTIIINEISCVVQMFSDKVTVVLPSKKDVDRYYQMFDKIEQQRTSMIKEINDHQIKIKKYESLWFVKLYNKWSK